MTRRWGRSIGNAGRAPALLLALILSPPLLTHGGNGRAWSEAAAERLRPPPDTTIIPRAALVEDLGALVDFLERTHPDPYGHAGKLAFHRRVHALLRRLPEEGMTRQAFHTLLEPFVASVGDGHTRVQPLAVADTSSGEGLPIDFQILAKGPAQVLPKLFVRRLIPADSRLAGAEIETIAGVPVAALIERSRRWAPAENEFGNLQNLVWRLWTEKGLRELLPEWAGGDSVPVGLRLPAGGQRSIVLARGAPPTTQGGPAARPSQVLLPETRVGEPVYRFLDSARTTVVLRLDNTWAYREVFESLEKLGAGNLSWAQQFYRAYVGGPPPVDTAALVEALPAATEVLTSLVKEMRTARTSTLVVDLRRNSGGTSALVNILLYYLYGRQGWKAFFGHAYTIRRLTESDLAEGDSTGQPTFPNRVGDYDFSAEFRAPTQTVAEAGSESYWRRTTISFAAELERGDHQGYYVPPKVIAVVSPRTFSGGFWLAAALHRMGARLVGVPSGQAGNAFANVQDMTLPHSGIRVGVSSRLFVLFPEAPEGLDILPVDLPLTLDRWRATGYDPNAAILLALEGDH